MMVILKAEGTVVDSGTTMMVAKLGKKLPDDLAEAKESKVGGGQRPNL